VTPEVGSSKSIVEAMTTALVGKTDLKELTVVGCDGTAVNTGRTGGVIRLLELKVKRPLQWLVCLLYANELPLRHSVPVSWWCNNRTAWIFRNTRQRVKQVQTSCLSSNTDWSRLTCYTMTLTTSVRIRYLFEILC